MVNEWDIVLRVVVAALLGAIVGYDRAAANKPAGIKTHMLVAAGSALFVGLGLLIAHDLQLLAAPSASIDVSRVIAGVVTGVGFLGAGAIITRSDGWVSGLTTAAGIWVVAAIGAAVAFGYWWLSILVTVLVLLIHATSYWDELRRRRKSEVPQQ
jgi:putative Mg2+ transporter-C (MgtC) family protein